MRIISGKYKNRELKSPSSASTHPMGERERLAIFNMLLSALSDHTLEGKTVLDLFAGTGSLGIEALSRGATSATFIENHPKAYQILKENIKGIENTRLLKADVTKLDLDETFDIVFLDPPYDAYPEDILVFKKFVKPSGLLVVSSPSPISSESRKYASCFITLL